MKDKQVAVILFIMCFLLTIGICVQVKTIDNVSISAGSTSSENELRDEVVKMQEKYNKTLKKLEEKEEELDTLLGNISNTDETTKEYSNRLEYLDNILGNNSLKGKGIVITVEDAEVNSNIINLSDYLVHDKDLLQIVNALANAGAEAIEINGQRIVSTTSISCAGNVIKINDEKVGTPYIISALGLQERLYGAVTMPGGYLSILKDQYGLSVKVEKVNNIEISKYNGVYKMNYATNNE